MLCPNCQKECADNTKFCPACGTVLSAPVQEPVVEEIPAQEAPAAQQVYADTTPTAEPLVYAPPVAAKPKKKKGLKITAIVVAAVVAVCGLGFVFRDYLMGLMPAKTHYQYVYAKVFKEINKGIDDVYDLIESDKTSAKGSFGFKMNDTLTALMGDNGKFGDVEFEFDTNSKDAKSKNEFALKVGGDELVKVSMGIDIEDETIYFDIPEYFNKPVKVDISSVGYSEEQLAVLKASIEKDFGIIIERDVLKDALTNAGTAAFKQIEDVDRSKDEIEINGVEQSATLLEAEIDEQVIADMFVEILEVLKDDEDVQEYVENLADEMDLGDVDYQDTLEDAIDNIDADDLGNVEFTHKTWVNSKCEILAIGIEMNGQEIFVGSAQDGKDYATEISVAGRTLLSFEGTRDGDKITGDLTVPQEVAGMDIGKISFDALDLEQLKEGYFVGKIEVIPGADLIERVADVEDYAGISLSDVKLVIEGNNKEDNYDTKISVSVSGQDLVTLSFNASVSESKEVDLDYSGAVDIEDADESIVNMDKLEEVMEEYGLYDLINSFSGMGYNSSYSDYDYDDYDYDDYDYDYDDYDYDYDDYDYDYDDYY